MDSIFIISVFALNLIYCVYLFRLIISWKNIQRVNEKSDLLNEFVSVIIPFREEEHNLPGIIKSLNNQNYPEGYCEYIFVNDHSSDKGADFIRNHQSLRIRLVELSDTSGKKAALTAGINKANGNWILTTDADCLHTENWIQSMMNCALKSDAVMVCGMVSMESHNGFRNYFQFMETAALQFSGAASLNIKEPLLCTGTNLLFQKDAWKISGGYNPHNFISSGDDTFLMLQMNKHFPGKIFPCLNPESIVSVQPAGTWKEIISQRLRWAGKSFHYKSAYIKLTGIITMLSSVLFLTGLIYFLGKNLFLEVCILILLRAVPEILILKTFNLHFGNKVPAIYSGIMVFFYPLFILLILLVFPFIKPRWKGRPVNNSL